MPSFETPELIAAIDTVGDALEPGSKPTLDDCRTVQTYLRPFLPGDAKICVHHAGQRGAEAGYLQIEIAVGIEREWYARGALAPIR